MSERDSSIESMRNVAAVAQGAAFGGGSTGHIGPSADIAAASRAKHRHWRQLVWGARIATFVLIFGLWELLTAKSVGVIDPFFWGRPSGIWNQLVDWVQHGTQFGSIWLQIWTTLKEAGLGFIFGVLSGMVVGITLGQFRFLSEVLDPYIKVVNAVPRIVLASLFIVAFGVGTSSKVVTAAVLVFFGVFFNAYQGVREVDRNLINNARVLGASRWQINRNVVLPSAATWIIASLHLAFGLAIIGAVVGEILGAQAGLGLLIYTSQSSFVINGVFAGMAIIALIALLAEFLISALERRVLAWRPPSQQGASAA